MPPSCRRARGAGPLPTVPTVVVTRGQLAFPPFEPTEAIEQLWQELQRDLLSRVPGAEQLVTERSGRTVPKDQPEAIVEAIGRVVEVIKRSGL